MICDSRPVTSQVVSSHSPTLTLAFWGCKCQPRAGVAKASTEDVHPVWPSTCTMAVMVAAVVRAPLYSETSIDNLLFRGSLLCHDRTSDGRLFDGVLFFGSARILADALTLYDALTLGGAPTLGDAPISGDAPTLNNVPCSPEDRSVLDDVLPPLHDVSEVSDLVSRAVEVVSWGFSRVLCCWNWRHWVCS